MSGGLSCQPSRKPVPFFPAWHPSPFPLVHLLPDPTFPGRSPRPACPLPATPPAISLPPPQRSQRLGTQHQSEDLINQEGGVIGRGTPVKMYKRSAGYVEGEINMYMEPPFLQPLLPQP